MYITDMSARKTAYEYFWHHENHDRPLLDITAPKNGVAPQTIPFEGTVEERWLDTDYVIKSSRAKMAATKFYGESLPIINPNLGPDVFAGYLGCEIEFMDDTSYSKHNVEDFADVHLTFDENNFYYKKIVEMTDKMLLDANGDYLVGITDLHGGMDALVSMRGPEDVCMDLYDCPEEVERVLGEVQTIFETVLHKSYEMFKGRQDGYTNWMGIYRKDPWFVASSDFIYLVSESMFDEFCAAPIRREASGIGNNIFHLDGIGSLRHIDKLLAMDEIQGVQWVYGAGQPTAAHWIDTLKQIQNAGKLVEILCEVEDMKPLFESGLKPEGVRYLLRATTEAEAEHVMKLAGDIFKKTSIVF